MTEVTGPESTLRRREEVLGGVNRLLEERGIMNIEVGESKLLKIPILSMAQTEDVRSNNEKVMGNLNIDVDAEVRIEQRKISFNENVEHGPLANQFPDRGEKQELELYTFLPRKEYVEAEAPIVIYSHGGAIRKGANLKSPFLSIIRENAENTGHPLILGAVDHRGSGSHEEKVMFSLEDRVADLEVTLKAMLDKVLPEYKQRGVSWNGQVILIGNSMGGHVATMAAVDMHPDAITLPQPAAYSEEAHPLPFGEKFTEAIRKINSWKTSRAFDALEAYLQKGGKALIIGAEEDEVVPGGLTKRYIKEVTYNYVNRAARTRGDETFEFGYLYIPVNHSKTHPDEIGGITKFTASPF